MKVNVHLRHTGMKAVPATYKRGFMAVTPWINYNCRPEPGSFTITHIPTGYQLLAFPLTRAQANAVLTRFAKDRRMNRLATITPTTDKSIRQRLAEIRNWHVNAVLTTKPRRRAMP